MAKKTSRIRQTPGGPQFAAALPVPAVPSEFEGISPIFAHEAAPPYFYRWYSDGTAAAKDVEAADHSYAGITALLIAGGASDGFFQYMLMEGNDGHFYLDRLGYDLDYVDERFDTGWYDGTHTLLDRYKHVACCPTRLVYFAEQIHLSHLIDIAVCDPVTAGAPFDTSVENVWTIDLSSFGGTPETLWTSSVVDDAGAFLYFNVSSDLGERILQVNLATGTYAILPIDETSLAAGAPAGWSFFGTLPPVACIDDDLVVVGNNRQAVRVGIDGIVRWWLPTGPLGGNYLGGTLRPKGDALWLTAGGDSSTNGASADLVTIDGVYVSTLELPSAPDYPYYAWSSPFFPRVFGNDEDFFVETISAKSGDLTTDKGNPQDFDPEMADWFPGGSDGEYNYLLGFMFDDDNPLYIAKFDSSMSTLLDRWPIPNWHNATLLNLVSTLNTEIQQVCVNSTRIVAVVDLYDWGDDSDNVDPATGSPPHYIGVAVFDTAGTLLAQHLVYTTVTSPDDYDEGFLVSGTGSCTDGSSVYFWHSYLVTDASLPDFDNSDYQVAKIDLATGAFTALPINRDTPSFGEIGGILILPDGDLITSGYDNDGNVPQSIVRFHQDGTRVWYAINPTPYTGGSFDEQIAFYQALAHSGHDSLWASGPPEVYGSASRLVHEYTYDGVFVQAGAWDEPVEHTWLLGGVSVTPPVTPIGQSIVLDHRVQLTTVTGTSIITS